MERKKVQTEYKPKPERKAGTYLTPNCYGLNVQKNHSPAEVAEKRYYCTCCGKRFEKQVKNFPPSQSPLYYGNNHFLPICMDCLIFILNQYMQILDSVDEAIKRICLHFDIYYSEDLVNSLSYHAPDRRLKEYISKANTTKSQHKTYDNTLELEVQVEKHLQKMKEEEQERILQEKIEKVEKEVRERIEKEQVEKEQAEAEKSLSEISKSVIERWGSGFTDEEYKLLEEHYRLLKKNNPNFESNQEIFIKDLCTTKLYQTYALRSQDFDTYSKATKSYSDIFKQAKLKLISEDEKGADETFGVTLATLSQYTPEEYYKDKDLYKDFAKRGEYIERFMLRPLRNLQFGTSDRDTEFSIVEGEDEE